MTHRVRLITLAKLPGLQSLPPESPLSAAFDELSAGSVVFENHYLQQQGMASILAILESNKQFIGAMAGRTRACCVVPEGELRQTLEDLPSWLNASIVQADLTRNNLLIDNKLLSGLQEADFAWLHFDTGLSDDDADAATMVAATNAAKELSTEPNDVVLLTVLHGNAPPDVLAFESLLWEGQVHVPLWMKCSDLSPRRLQSCTGSDDVGHTIVTLLQPELTSNLERPMPIRSPINLLGAAASPDELRDREIVVYTETAIGLRTSNFLYARKSNGQAPAMALYAKPEDLWNVNDVSAEYLEISDRYAALLKHFTEPGS